MGLEVRGLDRLEYVSTQLEGLSSELMPAVSKALAKSLEKVVRDAKANTPVDTGALRQSIYSEVKSRSDSMIGRVAAGAEYAAFVELGTGPKGEAQHMGTSPRMQSYVTYSPNGWTYCDAKGRFHYTLGQPARPFLYPAWKANQARIVQDLHEAIREALAAATGGGNTGGE